MHLGCGARCSPMGGPSSPMSPMDRYTQDLLNADGECFDAEISEYKYTICPFGKASQAQKTGGGNTNLGNFKGFTGPDGNKYSKMSFEGGQKCWNGPSRSLTVEVLCGAKGELSNIQEPSKCEYTGTFRHPAICEEVTGAHDEL